MDLEEIKERINEIKEMTMDRHWEARHEAEDELLFDFVDHVASNGGVLGEMAREVLTTYAEEDVTRWHA